MPSRPGGSSSCDGRCEEPDQPWSARGCRRRSQGEAGGPVEGVGAVGTAVGVGELVGSGVERPGVGASPGGKPGAPGEGLLDGSSVGVAEGWADTALAIPPRLVEGPAGWLSPLTMAQSCFPAAASTPVI